MGRSTPPRNRPRPGRVRHREDRAASNLLRLNHGPPLPPCIVAGAPPRPPASRWDSMNVPQPSATRLLRYSATRLLGYSATPLLGYSATRLLGYAATRRRSYSATPATSADQTVLPRPLDGRPEHDGNGIDLTAEHGGRARPESPDTTRSRAPCHQTPRPTPH